ncbi:class I adenylate-forming enzyme family protein [Haliea sp. E17]|uniref:class I adenylate-forming enzyme family protein n=1 Tax=Haliea sp. E17 TaxID=3401576 RepID=UPI003AAF6F56
MKSSSMTGLSEFSGQPLETEAGIGSLTLPGFLYQLADTYGSNEALRWRKPDGCVHSWSFAAMLAECTRVASSLLAQGVGKDARVGVLISNRPEWIFSAFGASMAGAVVVAMNTFSTRQELRYQLEIADVDTLIIEAAVASRNFVEDMLALCPGLAAAAPGKLYCEELPFLRKVVCVDGRPVADGIQGWQAFLAAGRAIPDAITRATAASACMADPGLIFFSSGSTALPKAIQQTHRAAMLQCWRLGKWYEFDGAIRTWSANGFFFSGNFAITFGSLSAGNCIVLQRYFDPDEALELFQSEQVACAIGWPHQEARLRECAGWEQADLSALRYVDCEGALATHPTINTGWRYPWGYGCTETFTVVTGMAGSEIDGRTYGPVLPGNTIRIVDPETNEILPLGETGEIAVKGPTLTPGYLKIPPEQLFDNEGFYHTADAGYFTADGRLCWEGRMGDIIKTGGANVSPTEIDAALSGHPAIMQVATVGVPHESLGEIVASCVVLRDGHTLDGERLKKYAKTLLASYKVPRQVLFFSDGELPMTGSNKVRRRALQKLVAERLNRAT